MYQMFNGLGWLVGYILYFFYFIVRNYGVAIILFTVVLNAVMFPTFIHQQKTMAGSAKMQKKMQELQKIYKDDKKKLQEEQTKMMEQQGNNPFGCTGCLMTIVPLIIFMGLFYALSSPLTNMLHLDGGAVGQAVNFIETVPGNVFASSSGGYASMYRQIDLMRNFEIVQPYLTQYFSAGDLANLQAFSQSFNFLGLDLLQTPAVSGHFWQTLFQSPLFILPMASLGLQVFTQFYNIRVQKKMGQAQPMATQGCMTVMMVGMSVWMFYITCIVPAAMGIYYVLNGVMGFVRMWSMQKFFSPQQVNARSEAAHIQRIEAEEARIPELPPAVQRQIEQKVRNWNQTSPNGEGAHKKKAQAGEKQGGKPASKNKNSSGKDGYIGKKK